MKVNVYLTFDGDCAQAFDFYKSVFGGDFSWRATLGESPMKDQVPADMVDRIMHVSLGVGENLDLMGCDANPVMHKKPFVKGTNQQIALSPTTKAEADRLFAALSTDGGSADQPLQDMFWGSYFGFLTDRFGIQWMIDCGTGNDAKMEVQKAVKDLQAMSKRANETAEALAKVSSSMSSGEPPQKKAKQ